MNFPLIELFYTVCDLEWVNSDGAREINEEKYHRNKDGGQNIIIQALENWGRRQEKVKKKSKRTRKVRDNGPPLFHT